MKVFLYCILLAAYMIFSSCSTEKEPIRYGTDACDHCKMIMMDPSFGGEIITRKGKIFKFDDVNCLVSFLNGTNINKEDIAEIYVIDYSRPNELISAETAFYVHSEKIKSPMASGIAAFSSTASRYEQQQQWQGNEMNWSEINAKLK